MDKFDVNEEIHQSISQKPSIQTPDNEVDQEELLRNTVQRIHAKNEEEGKNDYEMRIFTGSESLLREFKNHTPKTLADIKIAKYDEHNSHLNINKQSSNQDSKSSQSNKEANSSSSQSIFERNSF